MTTMLIPLKGLNKSLCGLGLQTRPKPSSNTPHISMMSTLLQEQHLPLSISDCVNYRDPSHININPTVHSTDSNNTCLTVDNTLHHHEDYNRERSILKSDFYA
jgi:hypothetical protein